jgi:hypothetical protein
MALPRRLIAVALSAAAAGALLYVSSKMRQGRRRSAVDEANDEKERVAGEQRRAAAATAAPDDRPAAVAGADEAAVGHSQRAGTSAPGEPARAAPSAARSGALHELALFLAGDAWHDEVGWQALWEKEGVASAADWLRTKGRSVLMAERQKLVEHPALLAGCRRRWIVVCRYAGIDVGEAATLWNQSETG